MTVQHVVKVFEAEGWQSASQQLVMLEIAYRADRRGIIRLSQTEIAAETALSRRTVAEWFTAFENSGVIQRKGHGRYQLLEDIFEPSEDFAFPDVMAKAAKLKAGHVPLYRT